MSKPGTRGTLLQKRGLTQTQRGQTYQLYATGDGTKEKSLSNLKGGRVPTYQHNVSATSKTEHTLV